MDFRPPRLPHGVACEEFECSKWVSKHIILRNEARDEVARGDSQSMNSSFVLDTEMLVDRTLSMLKLLSCGWNRRFCLDGFTHVHG